MILTHTSMQQLSARAAIENGFLIIGCEHSGTTLMQSILQAHPSIDCYDDRMAQAILARDQLCTSTRPLLGFHVPALTELLEELTYWDAYSMTVQPLYSGQKLLGIVRDARDIVASMFRPRVGGMTWFDRFAFRTLAEQVVDDEEFRSRYADELAHIRAVAPGDKRVALAALYWRFKADALARYEALGFPILTTRYEDLVRRPVEIFEGVRAFLEIEFDDVWLQHEHTRGERDVNAQDASPSWSEGMRIPSVGHWRQWLTETQGDLILSITGSHEARTSARESTGRTSIKSAGDVNLRG